MAELFPKLHWFLSFCRGGRVGVPVILGFNPAGEVVSGFAVSPIVDPWEAHDSWMPSSAVSSLSDLAGSFHRKIDRDRWASGARPVLHFYFESNRGAGGLEGSVILSLTSLETLYNLLCVDVAAQPVPMDAHPGLADKIEHLLTTRLMSTDVPTALSALSGFADTLGMNAPRALSEVRNAIVHSDTRKKRLTRSLLSNVVMSDAIRLSLWYIEMIFLKELGYAGRYWSRVDGRMQAGSYQTMIPNQLHQEQP
jgi:hypothetical protein